MSKPHGRVKIGNWVEESFDDDYRLHAAKLLGTTDNWQSTTMLSYSKPAVEAQHALEQAIAVGQASGCAAPHMIQGHGDLQDFSKLQRTTSTNDEQFAGGSVQPKHGKRGSTDSTDTYLSVTQRDFGKFTAGAEEKAADPVSSLAEAREFATKLRERGMASTASELPQYKPTASMAKRESLAQIGSGIQQMGLRSGYVAKVDTPLVYRGQKV